MNNGNFAVFLDLDNLAIGTKQANLVFDINLILDHIKGNNKRQNIVYRYACGGAQQNQGLMQRTCPNRFPCTICNAFKQLQQKFGRYANCRQCNETLLDGHNYNNMSS